jgi:hypothetical protein
MDSNTGDASMSSDDCGKSNRKWGWYSARMHSQYGVKSYKTPRDEMVSITCISEGKEPKDPYKGRVSDVQLVGEVTQFVLPEMPPFRGWRAGDLFNAYK